MGLLRILLAISVLTAHIHGKSILGFRLVHGDLAVQSFFMISGFYMALVLNQKYRPGEYWVFLQQRWLRLMPVYWILLALNIVTAIFFVSRLPVQRAYAGWLYHGHVPDATALAWFVFENIFIVGYEFLSCAAVNVGTGAVYFPAQPGLERLPALDYTIIGPAWSLSLEMMFYVLAPYLVRRPWRVQLGLVTASTLLRWGCNWYFHFTSPYFVDSCFPFELAFFLSGSLAYQVYLRTSDAILRGSGRWQWARWIFYAIVIAYSRLPGPDILHYRFFVCAMFIMLPVLFTLTKNTAWDRFTGELSYSFYLGHPLIIVLTSALIMRLPENRWGIAYLLACLCFSYLIYRFVESKIDRWRESLLERRPRVPVESRAPVAG